MIPKENVLETAVPSPVNIAMEFAAPPAMIFDWFSGEPKKGQTFGLKVVAVAPSAGDPKLISVSLQFVPINVD
jgi:hypothetical protein